MRIQHNIMAMSSYRNYTNNVTAMKGNLEKLSSGYKINRAGDDAAGLAISEKMRAQITGLKQAQNNAKSGINLVQTAEGALQEVQDMLNRMVKLAEQSANGTYDESVDRNQLQKEFAKLTEEIDRIGDSANFNGIKLLDGSLDGPKDTPATAAVYQKAFTVSTTDDPAKFDAVTANMPTGLSSVAFASAANGDAGAVKISYTAASTSATASSGTVATGALAGANFSYGTVGTAGNFTIRIVGHNGAAASDTASFADGVLTVSLSSAGGGTNAGKYTAAELETAIQGLTAGTSAPDASEINIDGALAADLDLSAGASATAAEVAMSGGLGKGDVTVTVETGSGTATQVVESTKWTGEVEIDAGGVTAKFDTAATNAWDGAEATVGTVTAGATKVDAGQTITIGSVDYVTDGTETDAADAVAKAVAKFTAEATDAEKANWTASVDPNDATKVLLTAKKAGAVDSEGPESADLIAGFTEKDAGVDLIEATPDPTKAPLNLQIGDTAHDYNRIQVRIKSIKSDSLIDLDTQNKLEKSGGAAVKDNNGNSVTVAKTLKNISVGTEDDAREALGALKGMVNYISDIRGDLGATQNRLDHTINNLSVMEENIQDAESTIRDTDVADEMMAYTKNNILIQSAQAMLAQANQVPQGVLQLLQ